MLDSFDFSKKPIAMTLSATKWVTSAYAGIEKV